MEQPSPFRDEYPVEESNGLDANCRRALAAAQRVSVRARASYWGNKFIDTTSLWVRSHTEKTKDLNAPLAPALPAGDESFNFRRLTEEEKKDFMGSLDAKGRQMLADLESPSKPVRARRKRGPKVEIEHNVTQSHPSNSPHAILGCEEIKRAGTSV